VKRYVDEPGSAVVRRLLLGPALATSRLTEVEIASALARRAREEGLAAVDLRRALGALRRDVASIAVIEVDAQVTGEAISLLTRHRLRAGDSVQLASCLHLRRQVDEDVHLLAYDERLNEVARAVGVLLSPAR
jgi:predicted nucleic acid-binding protein